MLHSRVALVALIAATAALAGCGQGRFSSSGTGKHTKAELQKQLSELSAEAGQFIEGGPEAFKARVSALRGVPIVVNQWASWCGPCRYEFPFFAKLADTYQGRVAFLGVNSQDSREDAAKFLKEEPVPYPHFADQDISIARLFGGGRAWPTTAFYSASGKLIYTHQGGYRDEGQLDAEIRKYALHG